MQLGTKLTRLALAAVLAGGLAACDDGGDGTTPLPAPTDLRATQSGDAVLLTWSAASGAGSYTVQRQEVGVEATATAIATGLTTTTYTDASVAPGARYLYQVVAVDGSRTSAPSAAQTVDIGARQRTLGGSLATQTLSADTTYVISGTVVVDSGAVLTIPAGTLLKGDTLATPSALVIRVGGKIEAVGTAADPIVFTSLRPEGQRQRGDWGGIVVNGRSLCNFPAPCRGEANSGEYGGDRLDDDSGTLRYVRIEYAGFEVSPNNELNGLTLNGVGSGTEIDFVQVHHGSDDGIEFFGGTVDVKHAIVTGASDDSFDYSSGWQGRGQFWIVQQDPADADRGFEVDGNENDFSATPHTDPTIYNVTLVGGGSSAASGESPDGMLLRRGTAGKIRNAIIMGFSDGIDVDDAETAALCTSGAMFVASSIAFDNGETYDSDSDAFETTCDTAPAWGLTVTDPMLTAPYDRSAPDFRPTAGSPAIGAGVAPPSDGFFESVDFIGGVDPDGTPWYDGWITTATS